MTPLAGTLPRLLLVVILVGCGDVATTTAPPTTASTTVAPHVFVDVPAVVDFPLTADVDCSMVVAPSRSVFMCDYARDAARPFPEGDK